MLLDILLGIPIIFAALLGLRDGLIRKLVAIVSMIGGLVLGQVFMRDVGSLLVENFQIDPADAPMKGFLAVFLAVGLAQGLLYRLIAGGYKIGGLADRFGGVALGFVQGVLFVSCLLLIFAIGGTPSRKTAQDSRLYKPVVNIAPQILDFLVSLGPETTDQLKHMGAPDVRGADEQVKQRVKGLSDSVGVLGKQMQKELFDKARKSAKKANE